MGASVAGPDKKAKASKLYQNMMPVLLVTTLAMNIYTFSPTWFWLHILSMSLAFLALAPLGILIKKIGGYENTKTHGYLLGISSLVACFGLYVIYTNKILLNKPHFTTTHGKLGLFTILSFILIAIAGSLGLDPNWGTYKGSSLFRAIHRNSGKLLITLSFVTIIMAKTFSGYLWFMLAILLSGICFPIAFQ